MRCMRSGGAIWPPIHERAAHNRESFASANAAAVAAEPLGLRVTSLRSDARGHRSGVAPASGGLLVQAESEELLRTEPGEGTATPIHHAVCDGRAGVARTTAVV